MAAVHHFRCLVEGRAFTLYTDHKPLTYLLAKQTDAWSARQQRHLADVAEYKAHIQHVPGVENVVADALSRPPAVAAVVLPASTGLLNWAQLATAQSTCEDLAALCARQPHHQRAYLSKLSIDVTLTRVDVFRIFQIFKR